MKTSDRTNIMAVLDVKNKLSTVIIGILLFCLVVLVLFIFTTGKQQTVVIIPKGLDQTVQIGQEEASEEYLLAMGSYIAYLFMNFDSTTVVYQYDTLSSLSAAVVRTEAIKMAEDYRKSGVSSRCVIQKIDVTDQTITVRGRRIKYILDKSVEDKTFNLRIKYEIRFGTFRISELELI